MKKLLVALALLALPLMAQNQNTSVTGPYACCAIVGAQTTTQQNLLVTPAGAVVFNSTLSRHSFYDGSAWTQFAKLSGDDLTGPLTTTSYVAPALMTRVGVGANIASATTIAPTAPVVHVTGTTNVVNITAPSYCAASGKGCVFTIIPDGVFVTTTAGNIALASTTVVSQSLVMTYDNATAKWYPSY